MKATKILCPVDFSPCSHFAYEHASEIAKCQHASIVLVHVSAPPPTYVSGFSGYGALPPYHPEPDPRLEEIQLLDPDLEVERVHLVGLEGEAIVKYASQTQCDLIVMGTHGYGGFTRFMLGSVADYVIRHAKCPVIIAKDRQAEELEKRHVKAGTV